MPEFEKTKGFQLKSGNKINPTSFFKGEAKITPPKDSGIYYKSPLEENDNDDDADTDNDASGNADGNGTGNEEDNGKGENEKDTIKDKIEKGENKEPDKPGTKAWKIAANALIGGFDSVYGTKTKRPTINWDKADEESEAKSPEEMMKEYEEEFSTSSPTPETNEDGEMIFPDDPRHSKHTEYMKHTAKNFPDKTDGENDKSNENDNKN